MHYSTKFLGSATINLTFWYSDETEARLQLHIFEDTLISRLSPVRLLVAALLCVSLIGVSPLRADPTTAQPQVNPHFYDYDSHAPFTATVTPDGTWDGVARLRVTYSSPVVTPFPADNTVTGYLFEPTGPGPHPVMLILHEWLPPKPKDSFNVAALLAKAHIAAFVMIEPYSLNRRPMPRNPDAELLNANVPLMVAAIHQCILDARRGLDWLSTRPEIDANRMGASGISLGGILAPLLAGADSRIKVVVAIDGGADVADLVWSSPFMRGLHPQLLQRGYTRESLRAAMAPVESSNWLHGFNPKDGLLFNGRYDVFVKPQQAEELSRAMGGAPIVWLNTGHYGLVFSLKPLANEGIKFLDAHFFPGSPPFVPLDTMESRTIKLGFLIGGHEGLSPALAYQIINFDRAGHYSLDGQLTLHGLAGAVSARLTTTSSIGIELPLLHGAIKPKPFVLLHIVL